MNTAARQLIFALDACEWNLIRKWAAAGKLPTIARLISEGTSGTLETSAVQLPDTVWSCIYGGRNPATFEKYFYVQYDQRTGDLRHVYDDAYARRPFWDILSDAGVKVGVVDLIKYPTSERLNGFQVTNWGAHAATARKSSLPADLIGTIESRFGRHPVGDCDRVDHNPRSELRLRERIVQGVKLRGEVMRWLMQEYDWDVFVAGFSEPHCIGHHFWHWTDETHPLFGAPDPFGLAPSMEMVYSAMDTEMGRMIEMVDRDTLVLAISGHGMGPLFHASWNLPEILNLLGFGRNPPHTAAPAGKARVNPWRILRMVMPGGLQYFIRDMLPRRMSDELLFRWYAGARDWVGHRAFAVPNNDSVGAIRVNLKGRDRFGIVEPTDYDAICHEIAAGLMELEDPDSGRKVVERVTFSRRQFSGEYLDALPDILVSWNQSFAWHAIRSPRFGMLEIAKQDSRSGSHSDRGFFIARGPGADPGASLRSGTIYDIAPTILQAAGVQVPPDMEGHALLAPTVGITPLPSSAPS
jgi:predicted AlkP superfamily phosphohydrolase/phosphomutase